MVLPCHNKLTRLPYRPESVRAPILLTSRIPQFNFKHYAPADLARWLQAGWLGFLWKSAAPKRTQATDNQPRQELDNIVS